MSSHTSRQMAHSAVAPNNSSTPKSLPSSEVRDDLWRFPNTSVLAWCSQLQVGHFRVAGAPFRLGDERVIVRGAA